MENTVISLGFRSTSIPALARSQSFLPLTFRAEYMGGICRCVPVNPAITSITCSGGQVTSFSSRTVPVMPWVSVVFPSSSVASYTLSFSVSMSQTLVALPRQTGSTPSASVSSVPVWPIFFCLKIPRSFATTSWDVYPFSLYTLMIPFIMF